MLDSIINTITKNIPASKGIEMLRSGIETIVGETIKTFDMIYIDKEDELIFIVPTSKETIQASYTGSNRQLILFVIKHFAKINLKKDQELDMVILHSNEDGTIDLTTCVTFNGEKLKLEIKNYKPN
jgi:hypothetical protein